MINGELIVDNFAGGGGASTGIEEATGYCVDIAINHDPEGYIKFITDKIKAAIGDECDPYKAACLNVKSCEAEIEASLEIQKVEHQEGLRVIGAMYHLENGVVDFI